MLPASIDFPCRRNADYNEELPFADGLTPLDITGMVFQMDVRRYPLGPLLFRLGTVVTPNQGFRIIEPAGGIVAMTIRQSTIQRAYDSSTSGQTVGRPIRLSHDIRAIQPNGQSEVWLQGILSIEPGVTFNG